MSSPLRLSLYLRDGCHLCEAMLGELRALQTQYHFDLKTVDIDEDPALVATYGERVPVLQHEETVICQYFLELGTLQQYFSRA